MLYNTSLPEAHEESTKEKAPSHRTIKAALKWPWMVIALVIAAAIAVGVSVGIWRHREHSSHRSSTAYRCGFCTYLASSWLTFIARRPHRLHPPRTIFFMIHLWQSLLSPMVIGSCSSKKLLVSSDVRFILHQTTSGTRARISMPARTRTITLVQTPRLIRHWQSRLLETLAT